MKRIIFPIFILFISFPIFAQLKITGIVDGPLSGGIPKAIEFYAMNDIADLSVFGFGSANNGGGSDGEEFTFPADAVTAGTYIYVASEATGFTTFFGFAPNYTSGAASINGDDAIELFMSGSVIDVFGDINVDGSGQSWEYMDGWAKRVDGTGPDEPSFNLANWFFSGPNALDGETTNSTAANPFPIVVPTNPAVTSTTPSDGDSDVALDANIIITFSEEVTTSGSWFDITGSSSGFHSATISGGPTTFALNPDTDFSDGENVTVTIFGSNITDIDANNMLSDFAFSFSTVSTSTSDWVINEIHADPASDISGDANGDGVRNSSNDEFVEIINISGGAIDISGWTLADGFSVRHTFPSGTIVPSNAPIVVFGGGTPTGDFGGAIVQLASGGSLGLNNSGDVVKLNDGISDVVFYTYGSEGGGNQSLTRDPDITGIEPLIKHSLASGSGGTLFSPGTKVDGSIFPGGSLPSPFVINEIHADPASDISGDANGDGIRHFGDDEFVELINKSGGSIDISGWTISDGFSMRHTFPSGTIVPDLGAIVVFGGGTPTGPFGGAIVQTASEFSLGLNNSGDDVILKNDLDAVVASYSYGSEGGNNQSLTRDPDIIGAEPLVKHTLATNSNGVLFSPGTKVDGFAFEGNPQMVEIYEIQGSGLVSPYLEFNVITSDNVVTALAPNGFFIQTPSIRVDADPNTSEGIFVFTFSAPTVNVGDLVDVSGKVVEFFDFTEIIDPVVVIKDAGTLPAAIALDALNPSPDQPQSAIEFEKYEGMLVSIANGIVTSSNQSFGSDPIAEVYIVAKSERTFREPGIEFPGESGYPVWDGNPEVFELDPNKLGLSNLVLSAGTTFEAVGVIGYEFGGYELWPTELTVNDAPSYPIAVRNRNSDELTVGSLNLFRLFDDVKDNTDPVIPTEEYNLRLNKFSNYILNVLNAPLVLAVQEVEKLEVLIDLANQIQTLDPSVIYNSYLVEGNDIGGIDVGFLVREEKIIVNSITQLGGSEIFEFDGSLLHDRPPLLLDASFVVNGEPYFPISVMSLHNRSLGGIDGSQATRVQLKRLAQAESIAEKVQSIQDADPGAHIVVTGDFNAFEFTDGYVDVVGIISGNFDPSESKRGGEDLVNPNLTNQVLNISPEDRYSFIFRGNAQVLDHALTSESLSPKVTGYEYGRGNADAAAIYFDEDNNLRSSDHDGLVLFMDVTPPQIVLNESDNLWPVNHKYQSFTAEDMIASISEAGNNFALENAYILKVTSDEPEDANGNGDGKTQEDIVIVDCQTVDLRAERAGNGNGRVYTIHLAAQDQYGNVGFAEYKVGVAHNKKATAIDDGIAYEVTSDCLPPSAVENLAKSNDGLEVVVLPTEYSLHQNYPNPFNPTTRIKYDVKEASNVSLTLYDMLGREVATLVNEQKAPGSYEVNFNASDLTSGIYFYTIIANNFVQTKKMLLMK